MTAPVSYSFYVHPFDPMRRRGAVIGSAGSGTSIMGAISPVSSYRRTMPLFDWLR